jgi:hypothetical protein
MPPAALDLSKTVTSMPSFSRCAAATIPLIPAPITATRFEEEDMLGELLRSIKTLVAALRVRSVRYSSNGEKRQNGSQPEIIASSSHIFAKLYLRVLSATRQLPMWREGTQRDGGHRNGIMSSHYCENSQQREPTRRPACDTQHHSISDRK